MNPLYIPIPGSEEGYVGPTDVAELTIRNQAGNVKGTLIVDVPTLLRAVGAEGVRTGINGPPYYF